MSALIGLMFSVAVSLLISGVRRIRVPGYEEQLVPYGAPSGSPGPRTRYQRWVRPTALRLADGFRLLRGLSDSASIARKLDYAGNPGGMTAHEFYGVQVYWACAGLVVGLLLVVFGLPFSELLMLLLPLAGFFGPLLWLRGRAKRRQRTISITLPDLLDMLAVCVSAGLGFDVALGLLAERGEGPLYEELQRLLRELRIGEPREQAFRHMAERNSAESLRSFVDALLQAEKLGTPIALTLERQAEDIRITRRHTARAEGAKAGTKISLLVVLLVMPSVLCLILTSLVMTIGRSIAPLGPGG
jgi:tight adherence protein C